METSIPEEVSPSGRVWGAWATLGFGVLAVLAMLAAQLLVVIGFVLVQLALGHEIMIEAMEGNGLFVSVSMLVGTPVLVGAVLLFARLRRGAWLRDYLGWVPPKRLSYWRWIPFLFLLLLCWDLLSIALDRPIVPQVMVDCYQTAYFAPLLWFVLVVLAPLGEETLFRGFMMKGLRASPLGPVGAVLITSLGWSVMHVQYDLYGVVSIFVFGLVLGVARLRSGSLYVPMIMHAIANMIATGETVLTIHGVLD